MKRAMRMWLWFALLVAVAGGSVWAQEPADQVRAAIDGLLAGAVAKDAAAVGKLLGPNFVAILDIGEGVVTREAFVRNAAQNAPPPGMKMGEFEPVVLGDLAYALVPLELGQGAPAGLKLQMACLLVRAAGQWQLLGMTLLVPADVVAQMGGADAKKQGDTMATEFEAFLTAVAEAEAAGDAKAYFDLCAPEAVLAGPYGDAGAIECALVRDLLPILDQFPKMTVVPADPPNQEVSLGYGTALLAMDAQVTVGGVTTKMREVALAYHQADKKAWRILATFEAPIK
jgi:hypothetical protein